MLSHEYDTMRSVEDDYWWYRILRNMTCREVTDLAKANPGLQILDAGCGTGGTMEAMRRQLPDARLAGFDVSVLALEHTRARGFGDAFEASVDCIALADGSQDAVVSLDVLYHEGVDQDKAMKEFHRVLRPEGRLIMNLPAFECLRGQHDIAVKNVRRYTPGEVRELHERNGFTMERLFCWNAWLFLPILLWRKISKTTAKASTGEAKSDLILPPAALNKALEVLGGWEASLCRAIKSPVGTSVFSVGRRKTD